MSIYNLLYADDYDMSFIRKNNVDSIPLVLWNTTFRINTMLWTRESLDLTHTHIHYWRMFAKKLKAVKEVGNNSW